MTAVGVVRPGAGQTFPYGGQWSGVWAPGTAGIAFMADIGALFPPGGAPGPAAVADVYRRHASESPP